MRTIGAAAELVDAQFWRARSPALTCVARAIQCQRTTGSILDVGCGAGDFLARYFPPQGWDRWGVELSAAAAQISNRRGIHTLAGTLNPESFPPASFDVATVPDALYYFPDPIASLRTMWNLLKPSGLLALEVPCAGPRIWRTTSWLGKALSARGSLLLETSDHIYYSSATTLAAALRAAAFSNPLMSPLPPIGRVA